MADQNLLDKLNALVRELTRAEASVYAALLLQTLQMRQK